MLRAPSSALYRYRRPVPTPPRTNVFELQVMNSSRQGEMGSLGSTAFNQTQGVNVPRDSFAANFPSRGLQRTQSQHIRWGENAQKEGDAKEIGDLDEGKSATPDLPASTTPQPVDDDGTIFFTVTKVNPTSSETPAHPSSFGTTAFPSTFGLNTPAAAFSPPEDDADSSSGSDDSEYSELESLPGYTGVEKENEDDGEVHLPRLKLSDPDIQIALLEYQESLRA